MKNWSLKRLVPTAALAACAFLMLAPVNLKAADSEEVYVTLDGTEIYPGTMGSSYAIEEDQELKKELLKSTELFSTGLQGVNPNMKGAGFILSQDTSVKPATSEDGLTLATVSPYTGDTITHENKFNGYELFNGIDVSKWQGTIDWAKVKEQDVDFAIIRVGYRSETSGTLGEDSRYKENLQNAIDNNIDVGVYIYSQALTVKEAEEEAQYLIDHIKGYKISMPLVIDYEGSSSSRLIKAYNNKTVTKESATEVMKAFCEKVKSAGYTPMIYSNPNFLLNFIEGEELGKQYLIWQARYSTCPLVYRNGSPFMYYAGNYNFWQYSSKGKIEGVSSTYIDCNYYYNDFNTTPSKPILSEQKSNSITLNFKSNSVTEPTGFKVYRLDPNTNKYVEIGKSTNGTFTDIGLTNATPYTYKVKAYWRVSNKVYYSEYSSKLETTTTSLAVKNLAVKSFSTNAVVLKWDAVSKAKGYRIFMLDVNTGIQKRVATVSGKNTTTYRVSGLASAGDYSFIVVPYIYFNNEAVMGPDSAVLSAITKPAMVKDVTEVTATADSITLQWREQLGAKGYQVYRYNDSLSTYEKIAVVSTNTYTDSSLETASYYKYQIRAYKILDGKNYFGAYSDEYRGITAPAKVTNVCMTANTKESVSLKWNKVEGAVGYRVYRFNPTTKIYDKVKTLSGVNTTTYTESGLNAVTAYKYVVCAYTKANNIAFFSEPSDIVKTVTKTNSPSKLSTFEASSKTITLSWNGVEKATGYYVYVYNKATKTYDKLATVKGVNTTSVELTNLVPATSYKFKVYAYKRYNKVTYIDDAGSSAHNTTTAPATVKSAVVSKYAKKTVILSWNSVEGASGYNIYRYNEEAKEYELVGTTESGTETTFKDTGLKSNTTYTYRVSAFRDYKTVSAEGRYSAKITVTTK